MTFLHITTTVWIKCEEVLLIVKCCITYEVNRL
jgi:hypothetical protein